MELEPGIVTPGSPQKTAKQDREAEEVSPNRTALKKTKYSDDLERQAPAEEDDRKPAATTATTSSSTTTTNEAQAQGTSTAVTSNPTESTAPKVRFGDSSGGFRFATNRQPTVTWTDAFPNAMDHAAIHGFSTGDKKGATYVDKIDEFYTIAETYALKSTEDW